MRAPGSQILGRVQIPITVDIATYRYRHNNVGHQLRTGPMLLGDAAVQEWRLLPVRGSAIPFRFAKIFRSVQLPLRAAARLSTWDVSLGDMYVIAITREFLSTSLK